MQRTKCGCLITSSLCFLSVSLVIRHYYYQLDRIPNESEAKAYIGTMNRANQAYFLEHQSFATQPFPEKIKFPSKSKYNYKIEVIDEPAQSITTASPKFNHLNSYTGVIFAWVNSTDDESDTRFRSVICASIEPGKEPPAPPTTPSSYEAEITCPNGIVIAVSDGAI